MNINTNRSYKIKMMVLLLLIYLLEISLFIPFMVLNILMGLLAAAGPNPEGPLLLLFILGILTPSTIIICAFFSCRHCMNDDVKLAFLLTLIPLWIDVVLYSLKWIFIA